MIAMHKLAGLCGTLLLSACIQPTANAEKVTERDLAVFKAVLQSEECERAKDKPRVISDAPAKLSHRKFPDDWDPNGSLSAASVSRSEKKFRWPTIEVCSGLAIVSGEAVDATFAGDTRKPQGWEKFEETFPNAGGVVRISLPVFTADGKRAFVYLDWHCGALCGAGFFLELRQMGPGWEVAAKQNAWIS